MSKLSDCFQDQLKSSCVGCTRAKDEIKILLNHITDIFLENPSKFLGVELQESKPYNSLEVFNHWAQNFDRDSIYLKCPHLKERVKHLVYKLLNKKASVINTLKRKFDDGLIHMLGSLKCVATDVFDDRIGVHQEWKNMVFKAREALYLPLAEASNLEEIPFRKIRRTRKSLGAANNELSGSVRRTRNSLGAANNELSGSVRRTRNSLGAADNVLSGSVRRTRNSLGAADNVLSGSVRRTRNSLGAADNVLSGSVRRTRKSLGAADNELSGSVRRTRKSLGAADNELSGSVRRSQRNPLQIGKPEGLRDHISMGPTFQADIPEWKGLPLEEGMSEDSKWLGTQTWPTEGNERRNTFKVIGKGRRSSSCKCRCPGSVKCIRDHVTKERLHLKSILGSSFNDLGFGNMGEEISKLWTQEEQMQFDDIMKQNPLSEGKSFMGPALECFTSKSRKDVVSFYYNVFLPRQMSIRTRQDGRTTVDYSDDEAMIFV